MMSRRPAPWYWANLLRHTSFSVASDAQRTPTYASRRWLPRASSGSQLGPVLKARRSRLGVSYGPQGGGPMSDDLMTKVQELIDSTINPAEAGHGGFVQLVDVKDKKVYIQMGGGCQGCGAADVTLKAGIERLIKEEMPEIEEVLDSTDHASGTNPYYTPAK